MGGSKQTQQTQSKTDPWAPAQPYLQDILSKAGNYANNTALFTPEFGQNTNQGLSNIATWSNSPSTFQQSAAPITQATTSAFPDAINTLRTTANGDMMRKNPYLDQYLQDASNSTANSVNQQFSAAGRYGSGAHTGVLANEIGKLQTGARMQDYTQERGNQLNASNLLASLGFQGANLGQGLDQDALNRAQVLFGAGQMSDQMAMAQKQAPLTALDWLKGTTVPIASLGSNSQGTATTTTNANPLGMVMGGLMGGLGLYNGFNRAGFGFG